MNRESELYYVDHNGNSVDKSSRWNSEAGYFRGLGADDSSASWVDAFTAVLPAVASIAQQREYNKMNLALINAGKPPVAPDQYMTMQPTTARVAVGPSDDAKKWIIYAGVGLLALVGLRAAKVI